MPLIDPNSVREIITDCLYRDEELVGGKPAEGQPEPIIVRSLVANFGFHPERLKKHAEEVRAMLDNLPKEFHEKTGGGWSFLNGCVDKHGDQWGEQPTVAELFALGEGLGFVKCPMPREMWRILPGGVPYFVVLAPKEDK